MKNLSVKAKITLWFSVLIVVIVALMVVLMLIISDSALKTDVKAHLASVVEANAEEIEFYSSIKGGEIEVGDHYVEYNGGYLEIDDDFLNEYNGIYTALYDPQGNLLYGESVVDAPVSVFGEVQTVMKGKEKFFIYSRELSGDNLNGLALKGTVSEKANQSLLLNIVDMSMLILPVLAIFAIIGGYIIAKRSLSPIVQISKAAEEISSGSDLSKRIEIGEGTDDVHMLADTFNNMFARLEKSFEDEKQFTSDISHELRTPITVVLAQSELILEKERTAPEYKRALEVIKRQSARMKGVVEEMLSFSRLDRMNSLPDKRPIELSRLIEELAEEQSSLKSKGIAIHTDIDGDITIDGDENLIERLTTNLITNAYRYGVENGNIYVSLKQDGQYVYLSVTDDGIGIPENEQDNIWKRFYQTDSSRSSSRLNSGVGLGLPMVSKIADLHGGRMRLQSREGEGSTFTFIIPKQR